MFTDYINIIPLSYKEFVIKIHQENTLKKENRKKEKSPVRKTLIQVSFSDTIIYIN